MTFEEQVDLVRNLKGAAASILWILLLSGRSLTNKELQQATHYSDKSIKDGLNWLERRGFVQFNGRANGYSLGITMRQLPMLFLLTAPPDGTSASERFPVDRELPELSTGLSTASNGAANGVHEIGKIPISSDKGEGEIGKIPISAGNGGHERSEIFRSTAAGDENRSEKFRSSTAERARDRKNSDLRSEKFRSAAEFRDSYLSVDLSVVAVDNNNRQTDRQQTDRTARDRKNSDLRRIVRQIKLRNPARRRVLERGDDPALVLAWWWHAQCEETWLTNRQGWIVHRLDDAAGRPETADEPDEAYLELATAWLALDERGRAEMTVLEYPGELARFWEDRGLSETAMKLAAAVDEVGGFNYG